MADPCLIKVVGESVGEGDVLASDLNKTLLNSVSPADRGASKQRHLQQARARAFKPALLVSSDDEEELKAVQALVLLVQGRLDAWRAEEDAWRAEEMERLIEMAMPTGRPHPAVIDQACRNADFRADFLGCYKVLDARQVHDLYGSGGGIFGIEDRGSILYPAFQFDNTRRPKPVVAKVLQALGKRGPWQVASWFTTPNGWLPDSRRPVDVMDTDPDAVVDAALKVTCPDLF